MIKRSPIKRSTKPIRRSAIKRKKRPASETNRIYGPPARRKFVASLPCAACVVVGYSENAHIETGGMGRKSDYTKIVPLCSHESPHGHYGCHRRLHNVGRYRFQFLHDIDLDQCAAETEKLWQSASQPTGEQK